VIGLSADACSGEHAPEPRRANHTIEQRGNRPCPVETSSKKINKFLNACVRMRPDYRR
jgi:hypothetical protein